MKPEKSRPLHLRPKRTAHALLRLVQVTDCHLYANPGRCLAGLNTLDTFDAILDLVKTEFGSSDIILATGDLVHDASPLGYTRMRSRFEKLNLPVRCLPGNHDVPEVMSQYLNQGKVRTLEAVQLNNWVVIMLDSTVPGREGGHLNSRQLEILEQNLAQNPDCHALICLHHHPLPIGSAWMDRMALDNPVSFFQIIDRFPQVRAILCGHIHQEYEDMRHQVRILGAPSTCIQFTPLFEQFNLDRLPPGLRWLELEQDGTISTGIKRLSAMPTKLDISVAGY